MESLKKKLQVFVSSTYTDLIEERQAAVESILDAGHIPAGMELFKAGNDSQLKTIYKWIDESDIYMLILGGRYGSIELESGKSYTQLEYEYAMGKGVPIFSVVLSEKFLESKIASRGLNSIVERTSLHTPFKKLVMSKIIREVNDVKDIKVAVHTTLNEFINDYELKGWVRVENENDMLQLLKNNNSLIKENSKLVKQIQKLQEQLESKNKVQFGNYSFDKLVDIFEDKIFYPPATSKQETGQRKENALSMFIAFYHLFVTGISTSSNESKVEEFVFYELIPFFFGFDFLERVKITGGKQRIQITKLGGAFYAMLEAKGMIKKK